MEKETPTSNFTTFFGLTADFLPSVLMVTGLRIAMISQANQRQEMLDKNMGDFHGYYIC